MGGVPVRPEPANPDAPAGHGPGIRSGVAVIRRELAAVSPVLPGELENGMAMDLLRRWAALDPAGAIRHAAARPDLHGCDDFAAELLIGWMEEDPDAAVAWVSSLADGDLHSQLMPVIVSAMAEENPAGALKLALALDGRHRGQAVAAVFSAWAESDIEAAVGALELLASPADRVSAQVSLITILAQSDPAAAMERVSLIEAGAPGDSTEVRSILTGIVLEFWSAQAPLEAAEFLISAPQGEGRSAGLRAVAAQWSEQDPSEALKWAAMLATREDRDIFSVSVIGTALERSAQAAASLAMTLPPGDAREMSLRLVIDRWIAVDPAGLSIWATSEFKSGSGGDRLIPVIEAWAGSGVVPLANWLNSLPPGRLRDEYFAGVAGRFATADPDFAGLWAEAIEDAGMRSRMAAVIGATME